MVDRRVLKSPLIVECVANDVGPGLDLDQCLFRAVNPLPDSKVALGEDPFGTYLDETLRGESVRNRPLVLQRYRRVSDIKTCHVLFISQSETDRLEQILGTLRGRNVLTVGDAEDFISRGGMIRLVTEKSKIRIRINMEAVKAANLTISSKLLRLAQPES